MTDEKDPFPLRYEGILDVQERPVAGFSRLDGSVVWLFNVVALEARTANRKARRLPVAEEERGLADLRRALENSA
jgi:hypothetical protein